MGMKKLVEFAQSEQFRLLKEEEIMSDYLWCSVGHTPESVAKGSCEIHDTAQYGCSECPNFKQISQIKHRKRSE